MVGKGITLMGTGEAKGDNRAEEAANRALNSPLLDNLSINGATGILFNITASSTLTLSEIEKISELITKNADPDATIKFGVIEDENAGDTLRVTVIATGFKEGRSDSAGRAKTPPAAYRAHRAGLPPADPAGSCSSARASRQQRQRRRPAQLRQRQQHAQHDPRPGKLRRPAGRADLPEAEPDQEEIGQRKHAGPAPATSPGPRPRSLD